MAGIEPAGVPTVNRNVPVVASRTCSPVRTVTSSPGTNGLGGWKLTPCPSESAASRPACRPLREPVTTTFFSWLIGTPRNAICV